MFQLTIFEYADHLSSPVGKGVGRSAHDFTVPSDPTLLCKGDIETRTYLGLP